MCAGRTALEAMELEIDDERVVVKPNVTSGEMFADPDSPAGTYVIRFGVDGAGLDAEAGVTAEPPEPVEFAVDADGGLSSEEAEVSGNAVTVSGSIRADAGAAIGVARSWTLEVTVIDPYTGAAERIVDEIFAYRVQWVE